MKNKNIFSRLFCPALAGWLMLGHVDSGHAQNYPNVTNYGAIGDLLALTNVDTISNSTSLVCPGANFLPTDTNKLIEVFGGGFWRGISNEDLITYISTVSSPTNITVSEAAGATATNLNGVYGTDDAAAFNAAIAACAIPTDTIIIPSGNYLLVSPALKTGTDLSPLTTTVPSLVAIILHRGGITFSGQGNAILTGCGGWKNIKNIGERGEIFGKNDSLNMTNDQPLVFTNLTLDGGVAVGRIYNLSFPVSGQTGVGWDGTHHWMAFGGGGFIISSFIMQNCVVQHWRGEMMEMATGTPNNVLSATNCLFQDGDASCINNFAHNCVACTFSNANQGEEFYRSYTTNASLMANCQFYLMSVGIALNGGYYGDATYTIAGNTFNTNCGSVMFTSPACDVVFVSNNVYSVNGLFLGTAGYQNNIACVNSNIVVGWNIFNGGGTPLGISGSGINLVENVYFFSNQVNNAAQLAGGGNGTWSTNVYVIANLCSNAGPVSTAGCAGQFFIDKSNNYNPHLLGNPGGKTGTNYFNYSSNGAYQGINPFTAAGSVFGLVDTNAAQMPPGAVMVITNTANPTTATKNGWASFTGNETYSIYLNAALTGTPVTIPSNGTLTFYWQYWDNAWSTSPAPPPPTNVRLNF